MMNPYQPLSTHYKSQRLLCQRELVSKFTFVSSVIKHGEDIPCSLKVLFPKITPSISLYSLPVSTLLISGKCLCHRRLASQTWTPLKAAWKWLRRLQLPIAQIVRDYWRALKILWFDPLNRLLLLLTSMSKALIFCYYDSCSRIEESYS